LSQGKPVELIQSQGQNQAAIAAFGDSFAFCQRLRQQEFFLQVTPKEHLGWVQEVPTVLKGNRQLPDEKLAVRARHLMDIPRSLPTEVWKHCSWITAGSARHHTRIAWQEIFLSYIRAITLVAT
jgi:hypothetical protein